MYCKLVANGCNLINPGAIWVACKIITFFKKNLVMGPYSTKISNLHHTWKVEVEINCWCSSHVPHSLSPILYACTKISCFAIHLECKWFVLKHVFFCWDFYIWCVVANSTKVSPRIHLMLRYFPSMFPQVHVCSIEQR